MLLGGQSADSYVRGGGGCSGERHTHSQQQLTCSDCSKCQVSLKHKAGITVFLIIIPKQQRRNNLESANNLLSARTPLNTRNWEKWDLNEGPLPREASRSQPHSSRWGSVSIKKWAWWTSSAKMPQRIQDGAMYSKAFLKGW